MITVKQEYFQSYEVLSLIGTPTLEELVKEVARVYRERKYERRVWNFLQCPMNHLHVADYNKIIATVKQYTGTTGNYRTALVLKSEIEQMLGDTFESMAMAADVPVEYRIFGALAPAIAWMKE